MDYVDNSQFRTELCTYCEIQTLQMRQQLVIPDGFGGNINFYECVTCGHPLSIFSGDSLSEWDLKRMQLFRGGLDRTESKHSVRKLMQAML